MTICHQYLNRSLRTRILDAAGTIAVVTGVLVALVVGGVWGFHDASTEYTPETGTVLTVTEDTTTTMCGKVPCTFTSYDTTVDLDHSTVTVSFDDLPTVGADATVYRTDDGYRSRAPGSAGALLLIALWAAIIGATAAVATGFTITRFE